MNANLLLCTEEWLQNLAMATLKESTIVLLALNHVVYIYSAVVVATLKFLVVSVVVVGRRDYQGEICKSVLACSVSYLELVQIKNCCTKIVRAMS